FSVTTRIVGGGKAPPEYGKFHASLQNLTGHHVCGSAIVSKNHLVTAAHCVVGADPEYIKAIVGTIDLDEGGLPYKIDSIHIHPKYNSTLRLNDIAVIKIQGDFDPTYVDVLKITEDKLKEDENVLLVGFGAQTPNGESSRRMLALNLTVFCQETCRYAMRYTRHVYDTMFCTFTKKGQGTCHGDSGSPLTRNGQLIGIVSWGIPCGIGFPDVHTRIALYAKWINGIIGESTKYKCRAKVKVNVNVKVSGTIKKDSQ
ncbi:chymotrypsin-1-like, partial [Aricia agestis]|uniref:chymotrypsin-1-like n=1 Tax=Aricia agestis TaxID=91739 RepID=UPI001C2091C1